MTNPLLYAAEAETVYEAAIHYSTQDFSVLPCRGKKPGLLNWKHLQERRADLATINKWDEAGLLENVGIICGRVSNNLVVIDLDGRQAVEAFSAQFPALLDTYTVQSGSGQGAHLYLYVDDLPPTTRVVGGPGGNVELRADGCYVVAPPSIHPSGNPYTISNAAPILRVYQVREVVTWIKALMLEKHGGVMPPPTPRTPVQRATGWAGAALRAECAAVFHAPAHSRNDTLNRAAFKLGQLVGAGLLIRRDVEQELLIAAAPLAQADGDMSVIKTIRSGLTAGINNPRKVGA